MKILNIKKYPVKEIVKQAVEVLKNGGLVIYPTETVYGVGVDATNQKAVDKLLAYKSRREGKPLSIAVTSKDMAADYVKINQQASNLYQKFLPGPVTVISKSKDKTAKGVDSEFGTLGIRIPDYPLILDIVKAFAKPITATSANASGKKRPYQMEDVFDNLSAKQKGLIDLLLDAGTLPKNQPSTVIDTTLSTPVTMREGAVSAEQKSKIDKSKITILNSNSEKETQEIAARIILKHWDELKRDGLIIALNGPLGVGKTIFTKGIAKFLNIDETLTSPTYTYINEYDFVRHNVDGKLFHADMWKVDNQQEFKMLKIEELIKANNVLVIEWWDQVKEFIKKPKCSIVKIDFEETSTNKRKLVIYDF